MRDGCSGILWEKRADVALSTGSRGMVEGGIFHFFIVDYDAVQMAVDLDYWLENGTIV